MIQNTVLVLIITYIYDVYYILINYLKLISFNLYFQNFYFHFPLVVVFLSFMLCFQQFHFFFLFNFKLLPLQEFKISVKILACSSPCICSKFSFMFDLCFLFVDGVFSLCIQLMVVVILD